MRLITLLVLAVMPALFAMAGCQLARPMALRSPDLVVVLKPGRSGASEMIRLRAAYRLRIGYPCAEVSGFAIYSGTDVARALIGDSAVDYVWPNKRMMRRLCEGQ